MLPLLKLEGRLLLLKKNDFDLKLLPKLRQKLRLLPLLLKQRD